MAFGNATKGYVRTHGGGGGSSSNYNNLSNKPQINGVELSGNKTASDLGIGGATVTTLYEASTTEQVATIELTSSYANYDFLVIQGYYSDNTNRYAQSGVYNKNTLDDIINNGGYFGIANNVGYLGYTLTDNDTLTKYGSSGAGFYISRIIGIKF